MDSLDIFLWPDGFWHFREESSEENPGDQTYSVIARDCEEWYVQARKPRITRPS